ncbi:MAG TPA: PepSY domain-containing protein [Gemmatimonadales bacterium]|nr:PepSY domain-containing protein [Gemmatimonadales bacterium]
MTRTMLWIHKWIGITLGVLVFIWLASGIIMELPFTPPVPDAAAGRFEPATAVISPAQAVALVATREQDTAAVRRVDVVLVAGQAYYDVQVRGGRDYLIDVRTGERLQMSPAVAEATARRGLPDGVPLVSVRQVSDHSLYEYPGGPLPAYRVEFGDPRHTIAYVSARDGSVRHTTRWIRLRYFISDMHTFQQLETLTGSKLVSHGSITGTSAIAILLVLTGYYLVLPRRWQRKFARRTGMRRG